MRLAILSSRLLLIFFINWIGCQTSNQSRGNILSMLHKQQEQINRLQEQVNDGFTLALCSPELRQLLDDVQKECAASGDMCTTRQIKPAVIAADPEHRGRFLKLMSHLPHEALYIGKGAIDIDPDRVHWLQRLIRRALLKNTVFLVVSSPEAGEQEAVRRARLVEALLLQGKIPPGKIKRWIYAFPANKLDIMNASDQPNIGETKEVSRGVWVFRADC